MKGEAGFAFIPATERLT